MDVPGVPGQERPADPESVGVAEMMRAALEVNMPNYANAIVTTAEIVSSISSL